MTGAFCLAVMSGFGTSRTWSNVRLESAVRSNADIGVSFLSIPCQLPPSPMRVLAVGIEHALDVAVQRPHDADPCEHRRPARGRDQDQRLHRSLPLLGLVLGLWEFGDVPAGVLQGDEVTSARQWDRFVEPPFPTAISHRRPEMASSPAACAHADQNGDASPPSGPTDLAMPENQPRSGSTRTRSMPARSRRAPG